MLRFCCSRHPHLSAVPITNEILFAAWYKYVALWLNTTIYALTASLRVNLTSRVNRRLYHSANLFFTKWQSLDVLAQTFCYRSYHS
jgi:hypothetical protein